MSQSFGFQTHLSKGAAPPPRVIHSSAVAKQGAAWAHLSHLSMMIVLNTVKSLTKKKKEDI